MGMFDTVSYTCPHCGGVMEIQTKAGKCDLEEYNANKDGTNLPPSLMCELVEQHNDRFYATSATKRGRIAGVAYAGPIECVGCGKKYKLKLVVHPVAVVVKHEED